MHPEDKYSFGPFRLDVEKNLLLRDNEPVELSELKCRILRVLLDYQDEEVVTYEIFWKKVWNETHERSKDLRPHKHKVTVHIGNIKKVLGKYGEGIVPVGRRGYRFRVSNSRKDETFSIIRSEVPPVVQDGGAASRTFVSNAPRLAAPIYCADLTQLIAADAYIAKLTTGRTEPLAASAFEYLTTILCNDTFIYFETPKILTLRTPVMRAWQKAALLSQPKDISKLPVPVSERSDKHEIISKVFSDLVKGRRYLKTSGLTNAQLLSGWTQYQLDDDDLQRQYWSVNTVDEMLAALDAFLSAKSLPKGEQQEVKRTLSKAPVRLSEIAREHWGNRPVLDFQMAWGYWNFVKGYRYVLKIPDRGAYVCHWVREDVCTKGVSFTAVRGDNNLLKGLFPWGAILSELVTWPDLVHSPEEIFSIIMKLREYTKRNFHQLTALEDDALSRTDMLRRNAVAFLQAALASIAPPGWERHINDKRLEEAVDTQLALAPLGLSPKWEELRKPFGILMSLTDCSTTSPSRIEAVIRIDRYREHSHHFVLRHKEKLERFWMDRGWLSNVR